MTLYKHHYKYEEGSFSDKRKEAMCLTYEDFEKKLKAYYVDMTDINQKINDKRVDLQQKVGHNF